MSDYLTEQEQIQQLKTWVKQYGLTVILGIVIALAITSGWHYWQNYRIRTLTHASGVYDEMLAMRAQNNTHDTDIQANKLLTHYPHTPYAVMAAFMLARDAATNKNYSEAIKQLNWVKDNTSNLSLREIARIRIARIQITDKKLNEALDTLNEVDDAAFIGLVDEVRGDAYLAKNDTDSARKSYQLALQELPNADVSRPILQMKFANLTTKTNSVS